MISGILNVKSFFNVRLQETLNQSLKTFRNQSVLGADFPKLILVEEKIQVLALFTRFYLVRETIKDKDKNGDAKRIALYFGYVKIYNSLLKLQL